MQEIIDCGNCGAKYEITEIHSPMRDKDTITWIIAGMNFFHGMGV